MKRILTRTPAYALCATLLTAAAVYASEPRDKYAAVNDALDEKALAELCASAPHRKAKLTKALNRMIDMGETPAAAQLSKEERRSRQFQAFWHEFTAESGG